MLLIMLPFLGSGQASKSTSFSPCLLPSMICRSSAPNHHTSTAKTERSFSFLLSGRKTYALGSDTYISSSPCQPELLARPNEGTMSLGMFSPTSLAPTSGLAIQSSIQSRNSTWRRTISSSISKDQAVLVPSLSCRHVIMDVCLSLASDTGLPDMEPTATLQRACKL